MSLHSDLTTDEKERLGEAHEHTNDAACWTCEDALFGVVAAIVAERERRVRAEALDGVEKVLTDWGMILDDADDFADEFAEAIDDSGAWRLARDLRAALGQGEPS